MKKKLLMIVALLCVVAQGTWAETVETIKATIGGLNYELFPNTNYATVLETEDVTGNVVIPSTVTYEGTEYQVTQIETAAFYNNQNITSVTMGDNMDYINNHAFKFCSNLASVTLGKRTRIIGVDAFKGTKVSEIVLPDRVTHVFAGAFTSCGSLETITIGNSVETIVYDAFDGCKAVKDIYCYANPAKLNWAATSENNTTFSPNDCFLPERATKCHVVDASEWNAFSELNLTFESDLAALVENNVYYFLNGSTAYVGKSFNATGEVTIRDVVTVGDTDCPVTAIADNAFRVNEDITAVTIGNNVTTIGETAFSFCSALETVTLPASLTFIGENAFYNCAAVTDVYCNIADPATLTWVSNDFSDFTGFRDDELALFHVSEKAPWEEMFPDAKVEFKEPTPTITLYSDQDNSKTIEDNTGEERNVTLSGFQLFKDGSWNTLCLPFSVNIDGSIFDGAQIMVLRSSSLSSDGVLTLSFMDAGMYGSIPANYPLLVRWNDSGETIDSPTFNDVTLGGMGMMMGADGPIEYPQGEYIIDEETGRPVFDPETGRPMFTTPDCTMLGCFGPVTLAANDKKRLYLGKASTLYYPSEDVTLGAFHAYVKLNNGIQAGDKVGSVRLFFGDDETTGMRPTPLPLPVMEGSGYYTLDGRRLNAKPTQKGIYIINGKKTIIK